MLTILCIAMALIAIVTTAALATRYRQRRHVARNHMARAFPVREFGKFDAHLEAVAQDELRRLEEELVRYLAACSGYVVDISKTPNGIALELSDGRRLALGGTSRRTRELLDHLAPGDMLQPAGFHRDAVSCRLSFRRLGGTKIEIHARNIALADFVHSSGFGTSWS
jgi:hypothetical protein